MAAHAYIRIGKELLFACRESYFQEFAAMFRDSEMVEGADQEGPMYGLPLPQLRERLDVLGFTEATSRRRIEIAYKEMSLYEEDVEPFDVWLDSYAAAIARTDVPAWDNGLDDVPSWTASNDPRFALRLVLERSSEEDWVYYDISDVVGRGHAPGSPTLCADAYADLHSSAVAFGPRIVMTEGTSDTRFVTGALRLLKPHLDGFIRFLDWDLKPEGNTSALVRAVRAFAAAGVGNQVVALFDNDTAAAEALAGLDLASLPDNFRVVQLPSLPLARDYPTIGPSGSYSMDVNGLACSIEMYFGEDVLRLDKGELCPVQWRGYMSKLKRYQGEVLEKADLQSAFMNKLSHAESDPDKLASQDWSAMELVVQAVVHAFD